MPAAPALHGRYKNECLFPNSEFSWSLEPDPDGGKYGRLNISMSGLNNGFNLDAVMKGYDGVTYDLNPETLSFSFVGSWEHEQIYDWLSRMLRDIYHASETHRIKFNLKPWEGLPQGEKK